MSAALHSGERAARDARKKYDLPETGKVSDLLSIVEERVGVPTLIERFEAVEVAGVLSRRADGTNFIAVNADHQPPRQRFTLAHELGHLFLGHQPRVDLVVNLVEGRSTDTQEVEANYFAAEFLCPRVAVIAWLQENDLTDAIDAGVIARLALQFGLSLQTAAIRLERSGAVTSNKHKTLYKELMADTGRSIREFQHLRLQDQIEALFNDQNYPRTAQATVAYAQRALQDGMIEQDEYAAIVPQSGTVPDIASWFS